MTCPASPGSVEIIEKENVFTFMIWNLLMADKSSAFFFILRGARRIFIRPEWKRTQPGFPTQCNQIADCDKNFTLIYQPVDLCGLSATWLADFNAINFNSFYWFFFNFWKIWNKIQQIDDLLLEHKENEPHQMIYAVPVIGGRTSEAESIYRIIPVSLCFFFSLKITKIFLKSSPQKKLMKETEKKSKKMAADDVTWRAPLPRDWCRRADPISSSSCIQIFISMTAASRTASDRRHLKWIIWINFHRKKKSLSLIKPAMLLLSFFFEI